MTTVTIDGKDYVVRHTFSDRRVLINYDGLTVFADKAFDGVWELSGEPAREHEKAVLKQFVAELEGEPQVTVTKP